MIISYVVIQRLCEISCAVNNAQSHKWYICACATLMLLS